MSALRASPRLVELAPGVVRLRADNPSAMTGAGTNSYLVGTADLVAIDPGPLSPPHLERLARLAEGRLRYVLVTHHHRDHAPGARPLAEATGATLLAFGPRGDFRPDGELADGDLIEVEGIRLEVLHTPGHAADHCCFLATGALDARSLLFSGDHVMGGSTVVVAPPEGDMAAYLASTRRLLELEPAIGAIAPGHGELITDARGQLAAYLEHRREREASVLALLAEGPASAAQLVAGIYPHLDAPLLGAAARQLWAHLRKLGGEGRAQSTDPDDLEATWRLSSSA